MELKGIRQDATSQADRVYRKLRSDLFEFELLPGDKFTETELARILGASRTPIRQALFRLEKEGYLEMRSRAGWTVCPIDFRKLEEFYDLRILLEVDAVRRLGRNPGLKKELRELTAFWTVPAWERLKEGQAIFHADEAFHSTLVGKAGNDVITRLHWDVTEKIRIVRRLDFTEPERCFLTYEEHARILETLTAGETEKAVELLTAHILQSRQAVQRITLQKLELARSWRSDTE